MFLLFHSTHSHCSISFQHFLGFFRYFIVQYLSFSIILYFFFIEQSGDFRFLFCIPRVFSDSTSLLFFYGILQLVFILLPCFFISLIFKSNFFLLSILKTLFSASSFLSKLSKYNVQDCVY